jgi:hypothetical protein
MLTKKQLMRLVREAHGMTLAWHTEVRENGELFLEVLSATILGKEAVEKEVKRLDAVLQRPSTERESRKDEKT